MSKWAVVKTTDGKEDQLLVTDDQKQANDFAKSVAGKVVPINTSDEASKEATQ